MTLGFPKECKWYHVKSKTQADIGRGRMGLVAFM